MKSKSVEQRVSEVTTLRTKFLGFGLPQDDPGVRQALEELTRFERTGESFTGRIRTGFGYSIHVKLSKQPHIVSDMVIRKDA